MTSSCFGLHPWAPTWAATLSDGMVLMKVGYWLRSLRDGAVAVAVITGRDLEPRAKLAASVELWSLFCKSRIPAGKSQFVNINLKHSGEIRRVEGTRGMQLIYTPLVTHSKIIPLSLPLFVWPTNLSVNHNPVSQPLLVTCFLFVSICLSVSLSIYSLFSPISPRSLFLISLKFLYPFFLLYLIYPLPTPSSLSDMSSTWFILALSTVSIYLSLISFLCILSSVSGLLAT